MAQFWIAVFFILLAIAQLCQSIKEIDLPFPVYLVLGMVLAIAANPRSRVTFVPTQQVTLQEIKVPDPVITVSDRPLLVATDSQNLAPVQLDAIEAKAPRTRKTAAKSPLSAHLATKLDTSVTVDPIGPKPKRTRKAAPKSSQQV